MESIVNKILSHRPLLICFGLMALFAAALVILSVFSVATLERMKIPNTEAGFIEAAGKGNLEAVRLFVDGGMKVTGADSPGPKAFAAAVKEGKGPVLAYLRQAGVVVPADGMLREKDVPFTVEDFLRHIGEGDMETVKLFLAAGMNPLAQAVDGRNTISQAIKHGRSDMKKVLIATGADFTPKQMLSLLKLKFDVATFYKEIEKGNLKTVSLFLEAGMEMEPRGKKWETALAWAIHANQMEMAKFLIGQGANFKIRLRLPGGKMTSGRRRPRTYSLRGMWFNPAMLEAVYHAREKTVRFLMEKEVKPGGLELMVAAYTGTPTIMDTLLKETWFAKDFDYPDEHFAYRIAKKWRKTAIAELLLGARYPRRGEWIILKRRWSLKKLAEGFGRNHPDIANLWRF